jgi:hypothetical protein
MHLFVFEMLPPVRRRRRRLKREMHFIKAKFIIAARSSCLLIYIHRALLLLQCEIVSSLEYIYKINTTIVMNLLLVYKADSLWSNISFSHLWITLIADEMSWCSANRLFMILYTSGLFPTHSSIYIHLSTFNLRREINQLISPQLYNYAIKTANNKYRKI